jgi:hypothetical protein
MFFYELCLNQFRDLNLRLENKTEKKLRGKKKKDWPRVNRAEQPASSHVRIRARGQASHVVLQHLVTTHLSLRFFLTRGARDRHLPLDVSPGRVRSSICPGK